MTQRLEEANMGTATVLTAAVAKYTAHEISATEFALLLTGCMIPDVVFRSNYTPSWEPLQPLFAECRGIDEIVARYDYENDHEVIHDGSGMPLDLSISGDVLYYTQRETASFFDRAPVTWDMVTKIRFRDGKIAEIMMFVDPAPIEAAYGTPAS
jgi:ketosteroid isomerase-like protein